MKTDQKHMGQTLLELELHLMCFDEKFVSLCLSHASHFVLVE